MSIRFRLSLLYTAILSLTLIVFGVALYSIQAQDTLNSLKEDLAKSSDRLVDAALKTETSPFQRDNLLHEPSPPKQFDEFSSEPAFQGLPEREIARILDSDGNLIASPFGNAGDALPLSDEGLQALQSQQDWWENENISGENMLIYNRPVVLDGQTMYIVQVARSLTERDRTLHSLGTTLIGAGLLTILIAFGVGWMVSGYTLRPITRITQTARTIGDERDFSERVAYSGPQDEVGQLANTFNQMLSGLQDAYQKVEHSLEMQRNFVADVSHELRTPLTTLRGNLGLLGRKPAAPQEEQDDILEDMVYESDRMIRLVNDLLLMARADAGRSLIKEPLAVQSLLEEAVRQARQLDPQRILTLDTTADIMILGDHDALKQVVLILLDNALKHSEGQIEVKAHSTGAQVEIGIQDHGAGISPETMEHIFDRFFRGDDQAITPGFGLGLPIAKALTESMGGTIEIESQIGKGSRVTLRFQTANNHDVISLLKQS